MKSKGKIVIIILMLIIILGGIGYYVITNKEETPTKEEEKTSEKKKKPEREFKEIEEIDSRLEKEIDELAFFDYFDENIKNVKDIDNKTMLEFVWRNLKNGEKDIYTYGYTLEDAQNEVSKYFDYKLTGDDVTLAFDLVGDGKTPIFKYKNKKFTYNPNGPVGSLFTIYIINIIDKAYKSDDDYYKVEVYKAYSSYNDFMVDGYYGSLSDALEEKNKLVDVLYDDMTMEQITDVNKEINKVNKKKLTKVTYVFKKVDNKYLLETYTINS